jgi:hypothetical protein
LCGIIGYFSEQTIHLSDIIEALEMQFDESLSYLDLDGRHLIAASEDLLREADGLGSSQRGLHSAPMP